MPTRVYVCPIIGLGTEDDPQRPAIADVPSVTGWSALIATNSDGFKRFGWTVCRVESTNFLGVGAVARQVPHANLDVTLPPAALAAIRSHVPVDDLPLSGTAREVIRALVRAHHPGADEEAVL